ncbi:MAG: Long-chain-fatty-acid--CoA ligase, partial [uncultured Acidimicrobiales bacterium]
ERPAGRAVRGGRRSPDDSRAGGAGDRPGGGRPRRGPSQCRPGCRDRRGSRRGRDRLPVARCRLGVTARLGGLRPDGDPGAGLPPQPLRRPDPAAGHRRARRADAAGQPLARVPVGGDRHRHRAAPPRGPPRRQGRGQPPPRAAGARGARRPRPAAGGPQPQAVRRDARRPARPLRRGHRREAVRAAELPPRRRPAAVDPRADGAGDGPGRRRGPRADRRRRWSHRRGPGRPPRRHGGRVDRAHGRLGLRPGRHGRAALHQRHHGGTQGRRAPAPQPGRLPHRLRGVRGRGPGRVLDRQRPAVPRGRRVIRAVRHLRRAQGGAARAVRAAGMGRHRPAGVGDARHGRPDDVASHPRRRGAGPGRAPLAALPRLRRGPHAPSGGGAGPGPHDRPLCRHRRPLGRPPSHGGGRARRHRGGGGPPGGL